MKTSLIWEHRKRQLQLNRTASDGERGERVNGEGTRVVSKLDHMERQRDASQLRELLETRRELSAWNEKRVVALAGVWMGWGCIACTSCTRSQSCC